jgi:hypothetical protein
MTLRRANVRLVVYALVASAFCAPLIWCCTFWPATQNLNQEL